jgi:hypothetical protein
LYFGTVPTVWYYIFWFSFFISKKGCGCKLNEHADYLLIIWPSYCVNSFFFYQHQIFYILIGDSSGREMG